VPPTNRLISGWASAASIDFQIHIASFALELYHKPFGSASRRLSKNEFDTNLLKVTKFRSVLPFAAQLGRS
jgi:hypothetical protein